VLWRHDGGQRFLTFENLPAAERFKILLEDHVRSDLALRRSSSSIWATNRHLLETGNPNYYRSGDDIQCDDDTADVLGGEIARIEQESLGD